MAVSKLVRDTVFSGTIGSRGRAALHSPPGGLGAAVEAGVDRRAACTPSNGERRLVVRPRDPGVSKRPVVPGAAVEAGVEPDVAERIELGDVGLCSPADDHSPSERNWAFPMAAEVSGVGCGYSCRSVASFERVSRPMRIAREGWERLPGPLSKSVIVPIEMAAGIVLVHELHAGAELEVAAPAAEPPNDLARPAVELVDAPRVAGRDEQVAVCVDVDRVDVEVVERRQDRRAAVES